jgi:predicted RNase H-like HicB family nuclease
MKTIAQKPALFAFGAWLRKTKETVLREAKHALDLHFEYCESLIEIHRRS